MRFLSKLQEPSYTALRAVSGFLFLFHGVQKLFGVFTDKPTPPLLSQIWVGGIIELVAGALLVIGLGARLAALLASGMMAVAYFQFHWSGGFNDWKWLPIVNHGESAVLYCFVFLFIATRGPGYVALDNRIK
jgi:putative oxidoreductase